MSLIVEDGSIVTGAESYISVLDANTYHTNRNNGDWAEAETSEKEAALRKATDYMLQVCRTRWQGWKVSETQALDWPRNSVYVDQTINYNNQITAHLIPNNVVPLEVKKACAEYALKALSGDLFADLTQSITREQVDKISVDYDKFSPQSVRYVAIEAMLAPFFQATNSQLMRSLTR